jgi:hypothetical protein
MMNQQIAVYAPQSRIHTFAIHVCLPNTNNVPYAMFCTGTVPETAALRYDRLAHFLYRWANQRSLQMKVTKEKG